jgi:hypothetical protein
MILMVAWPVYIIFFRLKNEGKAYRASKAAEENAGTANRV